MRSKKPPPEFVTFWAEIASLGGKPTAESMTRSRTPEELNTRAKRSATMRLKKQGSGKPKAAKKPAARPARGM
jgi:hypothetical protein